MMFLSILLIQNDILATNCHYYFHVLVAITPTWRLREERPVEDGDEGESHDASDAHLPLDVDHLEGVRRPKALHHVLHLAL